MDRGSSQSGVGGQDWAGGASREGGQRVLAQLRGTSGRWFIGGTTGDAPGRNYEAARRSTFCCRCVQRTLASLLRTAIA